MAKKKKSVLCEWSLFSDPITYYVQATGRAGRDGQVSYAHMLFNKGLKRHVDESMDKYCENNMSLKIII